MISDFNAIAGPNRDQAHREIATLAAIAALNMDKMMYRNLGRRPFLTENGYVGLRPEGTKEGDVVAVFLGAELPYALRPAEDVGRWLLVGDAYVYGVMDGEIVEKGSAVETFELI